MNIKIMNLRNSKPKEYYDFYIDRRSPIGNPYPMRDECDRDLVCNKYEKYFNDMIELEDTSFVGYLDCIKKALKTYGTVRLFCWCAPKRCHGETIKKWLEKQ